MSAGNLGHEDVMHICDNLECSPSAHDDGGHYGGAPNIDPTAKSSESATSGTHLSTHTTEFQMKDRSNTLPNYQKRFAKRAQTI